MTTERTSQARRFLEGLNDGPLRLGDLLASIRKGEGMSQSDFAKKLGLSRSHLCDIEKGRKVVAPARSSQFAKLLGYSEAQFVRLAVQEMLDRAGLDLSVTVKAASPSGRRISSSTTKRPKQQSFSERSVA